MQRPSKRECLVYTNVDGVIVNGLEMAFRDNIGETIPDPFFIVAEMARAKSCPNHGHHR